MNLDAVSWPMVGFLFVVFVLGLAIWQYLKHKEKSIPIFLKAVVISVGLGFLSILISLIQDNGVLRIIAILFLIYAAYDFLKRRI